MRLLWRLNQDHLLSLKSGYRIRESKQYAQLSRAELLNPFIENPRVAIDTCKNDSEGYQVGKAASLASLIRLG